MAVLVSVSEDPAETAAAAGEERLRRHRVARDRARSSTQQTTEQAAPLNIAASPHGAGELRPVADRIGEREPRGRGAISRQSAASKDGRADSRPPRAGSRQALVGASRRTPSVCSKRNPRGPSRGEVDDLASAPHRQEPEDLESRWQNYIRSEEYLTFQAAVDSLRSLPAMDQLTDRRVDFEVLLHLLHRLGCTLEVEHASKSYRAHYSPDVQLCGYLYSTLLTAFTLLPSYVLNGQEFYVSDTVLDQCKSLQFVFQETCTELKKQFENLQSYSLEHIRNDVKRSLVYFDRSWCRFEMPALEEIEAIHRQACRPLIEAIEADQALLAGESKGSSVLRGSAATGSHKGVKLQVLKDRLMEKLCELNRLANIDGKGRADMDMTCVLEAERIAAKPMCMHLRKDDGLQRPDISLAQGGSLQGMKPMHKCNGCASPVLLRIARTLLRTLARVRRILQRYVSCLYQLNSHLANNRDLVRGLELFENAWETANRYLVQAGPRRVALLTYDIVSGVQDADFEASLNNLDPGFLVASLPRALIVYEMRRHAAATKSSREAGQETPAQALKSATTSLPKIAMTRGFSNLHASATPSMLPRPLEVRRAVPSSAFQHSPIARTFLPADVMESYNEAAIALERLPASRLPWVCSLLISPPQGSSRSTPLPPTSGGRAKSGGIQRQATAPPPRTPCPPRMAVPTPSKGCTPRVARSGGGRSPHIVAANISAHPTQVSAQSLTIAPGDIPEESDDEEDDFAIDLTAQIQNAELARSPEELGELGAAAEEALAAPTKKREGAAQDPATRRVVMTISTLALHLQRAKPHEWNELIQVVLQGFMLVKSARTRTGSAAPCVAGVVGSEVCNTARGGAGHVPAEVW